MATQQSEQWCESGLDPNQCWLQVWLQGEIHTTIKGDLHAGDLTATTTVSIALHGVGAVLVQEHALVVSRAADG